MKYMYKIFTRLFFAVFLLIAGANEANACHGVALVGLVGVQNPSNLTISGSSDPATCGCGPYWMQVEVTCNPSGFTGAPPTPSSNPLWGTAPWYESGLNVPGYGPPSYLENCALEPYFDVVVPFAQLCPGTTYYWRAREFVEGSSSAGPWSNVSSFLTPGLPPSAILSTTSSAYAVCPGSTVQLNANVSGGCPGATFTYSWVPTTGLSNPNIANPTALISGGITYTVTVTGGCFTITSSDDTVRISMGPTVVAGTATPHPASLCSGQSSLVILTGMGSNTIQWQVSPNSTSWFNIPSATNDTLNTGPLSSSLYYQAIVTGSGWPGTGCGTAISAPILVTVNPAPTANAGVNQTVCSGGCATLVGTGGVSYNWMPGNLSGVSVSVCPVSNTTYTLTVTDINGCTATDNVIVNLSNATVTASPDVSICNGNNTILLATGPNGNTYSWQPSGTLIGATTANPTASPSVTTTYTVTATSLLGCISTDIVIVTVTNAPPLTVSNDTSFCAGGNATLTASGSLTYVWQPGNISGPTITVSPNSTTTYTVTGNNNNCISADSIVVNVSAPPFVFAGPDLSICSGSQATLNVANTGSSYLWTPPIGILGSNTTQSVIVQPTVTTSYTITVTGPGGCISSDTINLVVNANPTVTASSPDNSICVGSSTMVSASGATTYTWIPTVGLQNPNIGTTTANPTNTTTYQVIGTNANGCTDTASITITVNPLPLVYMIPTPTECGDTTGAITLGGVISGTGPFTYTVGPNTYNNLPITNLNAGGYTITTTDANGCVSTQVVNVGTVNTASIIGSANPTYGVYPLAVGFGATGTTGIDNYFWNFGDLSGTSNSQAPSYTYVNPGTYTVILTAWNSVPGCAVYDTLTITVVDQAIISLPNVFTPNSDGTNDFFYASVSGVKNIKVEVFNRWGGRVFDGEQSGLPSNQQDVALWDGKAGGGKISDDGVYYYIVTATGYDSKDYTFTGFVHLLK